MLFNEDTFESAMEIYGILQRKGTFRKEDDPVLFREYRNEEVSEMLLRLEKVNKVRIGRFEDKLEMIPEIDNELHRFTNEELRKQMGLQKNRELYTIQFIWMVLLGKFYGDQYENTLEPRSFVLIDEVRDYVDECVETFKKQKREKADELTEEYELSINDIIETWDSLGTITEDTKSIARSKTKDFGFMFKGLRFWVDQKLIFVHEEAEIVLTDRGKMIPELYYHQEDNIHKIQEIMKSIDGDNTETENTTKQAGIY